MTIPQRIVLHVTVAGGLGIALVMAVTYGIVYNAAKERDLSHLETYVRERAQREESYLQQVAANLTLVRGQFFKRMEAPMPANHEQKWNERFRKFPDGAWRSKEEFADGRKWSTLWAHKNTVPTPEWQIQILRAQDICDELLPGWVDTFPSVYFVMPGPSNIGFDPRIPAWVWDTPSDYEVSEYEWYQVAMPKELPGPGLLWSGLLEEPTCHVPLVSAYLPIIEGGKQLGAIGHDIWLSRLMDETARSQLPGAMHVIFRKDGRIIAHPTLGKEIMASKGNLKMQELSDPKLISLFRSVSPHEERRFSGYEAASGLYYNVARLAGPEWFYVTTMPREQLHQQAFKSSQWVLWAGVGSLGVLLGFLAITLRWQIAKPLEEISRATRQMSAGESAARATVTRNDELGELASSFNEMAGRVANREAELRQLNQDLENRVELRTSELTAANLRLDEAHAEALKLLARERELNELKSDFVSLVSREFRTPLEIILSSTDNLDRYHDRLPLEKREQLLRTIHKAVKRMAGMMEEVLVLGRVESGRMEFTPVDFDLQGFSERVCDEIRSTNGTRCDIKVQLPEALPMAHGDENLLRHILSNLLSNAVKYSPAGGTVTLTLERDVERAVIRVVDHGCGIPAGDQPRLFEAFHRGSNVRQIPGTGLGLLIVRRCVELHGGEIQFASAEGEGTTFTVRLPLFLKNPRKP